MDLKKYRDKVNANLIKCVYKIRKQIMDIYQIKQVKLENEHGLETNTYVPIKSEPDVADITFLSTSLERLTVKTEQLKTICDKNSYDSLDLDELIEIDVELKNENNINAVTIFLISHVNILIEQTSFAIEIYKTVETQNNLSQVKKCLNRVNKNIKSLLFNVYDKNLVSDQPNNVIGLNDLGEKMRILSRKISKLTSYFTKKNDNTKSDDMLIQIDNESVKLSNDNNGKEMNEIRSSKKNKRMNEIDNVLDYVSKLDYNTSTDSECTKKNKMKKKRKSNEINNSSNCDTSNNSSNTRHDINRSDESIVQNQLSEDDDINSNIDHKNKERCEDIDTEIEFKTPSKKFKMDNSNHTPIKSIEKKRHKSKKQIHEPDNSDNEYTNNNMDHDITLYSPDKTGEKRKNIITDNLDNFISNENKKKSNTATNSTISLNNISQLSETSVLNSMQDFDEEISLECDNFVNIQSMVEETENQYVMSEDVKEQLRQLVIAPTWNIPESHSIETRLVSGPTKEQKEHLLQLGIKCGAFTKIEDNSIKTNFEKFCKEYDFQLDARPFLIFQIGNETPFMPSFDERSKFIQYLGQDLPHRMLSSIYRRFKVLYTPVKKGRFTKKEDDMILTYVKNVRGAKKKEPKFTPLCKVLNRNLAALQTRYKYLKSIQHVKCVKWSTEMNEKLLLTLMETLNIEDVQQLRNAKIDYSIFEEIGVKMDLAPVKIKIQWYTKLYTQLFAEESISFNRVKAKIAEKLIVLKVNDWKTVNWEEVASHFNGFSGHFIAYVAKSLIRHNVPHALLSDLRKCLRYIEKYYVEPGRPLTIRERVILRYNFKDGHLIEQE